LNVGQCAPLFDRPGLAFQAEFLDGPLPSVRPMTGFWSDKAGNA
jgi:hypothetical protein